MVLKMNYNKINQKFLGEYLELDKTLCEKFSTKSGVTEYIKKLSDAKHASGRDNVLPRLTKYRSLRNRIAHEPGALKDIDTITKDDILWLKSFRKSASRGKDPLSRYLKRASDIATGRAFKRALILAGIAAAALAVIALVFILI